MCMIMTSLINYSALSYPEWLPTPDAILDDPLFKDNQVLLLTGALFSVILGFALMLWGEKLFRLWMVLTGLWIGWQTGTLVVNLTRPENIPPLLVSLGLAVGCALLFVFLFRVSIVIAGFAAGIFWGWKFLIVIIPSQYALIAALICGTVGAILAGAVTNFFIRAITALSGAWLLVNGAWNLLPTESIIAFFADFENPLQLVFIILNLLVVLLAVVGFLKQNSKASPVGRKRGRKRQRQY